MKLFIEKLSKLRIGWNKKPFSEHDFHRLCRRFKVNCVEIPLEVYGFYYCVKGKHYIAIDERLRGFKKLFVQLHELAHFLRHVPATNTTANFYRIDNHCSKDEQEADMFAICALIPQQWVKTKTYTELLEEEMIPAEYIDLRKKIYDTQKI